MDKNICICTPILRNLLQFFFLTFRWFLNIYRNDNTARALDFCVMMMFVCDVGDAVECDVQRCLHEIIAWAMRQRVVGGYATLRQRQINLAVLPEWFEYFLFMIALIDFYNVGINLIIFGSTYISSSITCRVDKWQRTGYFVKVYTEVLIFTVLSIRLTYKYKYLSSIINQLSLKQNICIIMKVFISI